MTAQRPQDRKQKSDPVATAAFLPAPDAPFFFSISTMPRAFRQPTREYRAGSTSLPFQIPASPIPNRRRSANDENRNKVYPLLLAAIACRIQKVKPAVRL